jgi:hypothetical protein
MRFILLERLPDDIHASGFVEIHREEVYKTECDME